MRRLFRATRPRGLEGWVGTVYLQSADALALVAAAIAVEMVDGRYDAADDDPDSDHGYTIAAAALRADLLRRYPSLPRDPDGELDTERLWWIDDMLAVAAVYASCRARDALLALRPPTDDDGII